MHVAATVCTVRRGAIYISGIYKYAAASHHFVCTSFLVLVIAHLCHLRVQQRLRCVKFTLFLLHLKPGKCRYALRLSERCHFAAVAVVVLHALGSLNTDQPSVQENKIMFS